MSSPGSSNNTSVYFSLIRDSLHQSYRSDNVKFQFASVKSCSAIWLQNGQLQINGKTLACGAGTILCATNIVAKQANHSAVILRFVVSLKPLPTQKNESDTGMFSETIFSKHVDIASRDMLLRLDQVDFPPCAVAHKHTHPGPGIRYLVEGGLTLLSNHDEQLINAGEAWFEDANNPVTATAIKTMPSRFIRAMLLPVEYEGRSTFTLYNKADAKKPRLQSNTRHAEKRISFNATQ